MTFLRRSRGQKFLAERKVGGWPFPCEVIRVTSESMVVRQWIPEGVEEDYVEPEHKNTEIEIFLDPEVMETVYVYVLFGWSDDRGMHIEATWHRLTDGSWYMDEVTVVRL